MDSGIRREELQMEAGELCLEEVFTDGKVGSVRRLTPVKTDGGRDEAREVSYVGQTQILTPAGTLPISFEIEAASLEEALARFPDAAERTIERTLRELQEMRREASSRIVVPEGDPGGAPGGGKIQIP